MQVTTEIADSSNTYDQSVSSRRSWKPPTGVVIAVLIGAFISSVAGVFNGPALGDHEAIVAQCAREMRMTGDWIVPKFLEKPFIRKPPLPVWMEAAASYLFPNDPATGLPVTAAAARLPSALCAFGAILLLWRLASSMFGRRAGIVTAVVSASSVGFLLYAPNATAEMPLVFCCVWAYFHFWFAATTPSNRGRLAHSLTFYVALGFAMLAKGPAPVALVGFPLAVWWYVHRPLRLVARGGITAWRKAAALFLRELVPQTLGVFTRLWFFPGILLFGLLFVPWMLAVAQRHDHAWELWNWQFLQRAKGDYPDTRQRSIAYYLPILGGLILPWTFLVLEAAIAPWVRRYARLHRPLLFAGLWVLLATLSMSLMEFKKPYYVLPAVPGLILLVAVAADRIFLSSSLRAQTRSWPLRACVGVQLAALVAAGWMWLADEGRLDFTLLSIVALAGVLLAGAAIYVYRRGRGELALAIVALVTVLAFHVVWHEFGKSIENIDKVARLASTLDEKQVPPGAKVYWADRRPDARLGFYFNRRSAHMVDAHEIVGAGILNRETDKHLLEKMAINRALDVLGGSEPVYLIIRRDHYDMLSETFAEHAELFASMQTEGKPTRHDWVIVSNAGRLNAALR